MGPSVLIYGHSALAEPVSVPEPAWIRRESLAWVAVRKFGTTMYRIIIILILLTILYFLIRSAIRALHERGYTASRNEISDKHQMVQDPVCRVFIPKGTAVQEEIGGQSYFFCSRECAKTFQKQLAG